VEIKIIRNLLASCTWVYYAHDFEDGNDFFMTAVSANIAIAPAAYVIEGPKVQYDAQAEDVSQKLIVACESRTD
jgi:hypothetical protein